MTELRPWQKPLSDEAKAKLAAQFARMGRYYRSFEPTDETISAREIRAMFRASRSDYANLKFSERDEL